MTATRLLLTLAGVLDAVTGSTPAIDVDATRIDERHTGQMVADWVDTFSDSQLANWRLRSSD